MSLNPVPALPATCSRPCDCRERVPRYPSDLSDGQWAVLEPLLPATLCLTELSGQSEKHARRAVADALPYVLDTGR